MVVGLVGVGVSGERGNNGMKVESSRGRGKVVGGIEGRCRWGIEGGLGLR